MVEDPVMSRRKKSFVGGVRTVGIVSKQSEEC